MLSITDDFWLRVDKDGPIVVPDLGACWLWTGAQAGGDEAGAYGQYRHILAHRYVMDAEPDEEVDHMCHVRLCVRPSHLQRVPKGFNAVQGGLLGGRIRGAQESAKTHCPKGHEYAGENLLIIPSRPRARYCRICNRERSREWRSKSAA